MAPGPEFTVTQPGVTDWLWRHAEAPSAPSAVPYPRLEHLATTENRAVTSASQATECIGTTTEWP